MAETTAVALLFDDAELGGHLRDALRERGAQIVHEGALRDLTRELLQGVGADVVVINLDESTGEALDCLNEAIDGDYPRVVFNEAQSSRALDGWDRARWARHLAAKVLARGDIDPPRPPMPVVGQDAPVAAAPDEAAAAQAGEVATGNDGEMAAAPLSHEAEIAAESETLEAELEALLSGDPLPDEETLAEGSDGSRPDRGADFDLDPDRDLDIDLGDTPITDEALERALNGFEEPLYDGNFLDASAEAQPPAPASPEHQREERRSPVTEAPASSGDTLSLVDELTESGGERELSLADDIGDAPSTGSGKTEDAVFRLSDSWSLVEDDSPAVPPKPDPSEFGVQKMTAADYLAPDSDPAEPTTEPYLSLELVSLQDAIAPTPYEPVEMLLGELEGALTRIVVLGAAANSRGSVREFLAKLPAGMRATIVHTQHLAGRPAEELVEELARVSPLPVRLARQGLVARVGELLVVPADTQLRLLRDGTLELKAVQDMPASSPSIDGSFTAAANVFGSDALAILFAGQANDAVAGCQAIHDRGGRIWVEDAPGEHFADMVSGVMAEHLADFSGTPAALAARLIEEY